MRFQVGTDVGGTFTDLWVRADDGRQAVLKSPSTADIIGGILHTLDLASVVPRQLVVEVAERVDRKGEIVVPLADHEIEHLLDRLSTMDVQAVAVATLWSVANPNHEQRIAAAARERFPDLFVSMSHEVAPAVGEYARMSTTAANAALGPVMSDYLARLDDALRQRGLTVPVMVMTSEGGVVAADVVSDQPVSVLMSGPAAGVIACQRIGRRLGRDHLLTVDIGGTSFDVGTVVRGEPLLRDQFTVAGVDVQRPAIDVATIGAGGGSIARVRDGALTR